MLISAGLASNFLMGLSNGENGEVWDDSCISSLLSAALSLPVAQDRPTVASLWSMVSENATTSLCLHFPPFLGEGGQRLPGVICLWVILSLDISSQPPEDCHSLSVFFFLTDPEGHSWRRAWALDLPFCFCT